MLANGERQVAPDVSGIRRDHVARYEFAARGLTASARVIDLACGVGYGASILADAGHSVVALDRSAPALEYGRAHYARGEAIRFECQDVAKATFDQDTFDAAVCFETIEHLEDPLPMLRQLHRAAPILIASVPNETIFPHQGQIRFHYRHYTRAQFEALLKKAGFVVTAWFGQSGPHSEVEPNVEGRTLVAVAHRAPQATEVISNEVHAVPEAAPAAHIAIVGLGPSCATFFELTRRLGGASAYCDEVWGLNAMGDVMRCDRIFHMDDLKIQEARAALNPNGNIAAMVRWLKNHPGPIYTSVVREGYPGCVPFPLEDVLNSKAGDNGGAPYFNSTAAYAVAAAVTGVIRPVGRISLFGLDYTLANAHKAEQGRACVEFWLGIAAARGIAISVPETSSLLDGCSPDRDRLYGYDCVDVHFEDGEDGRLKLSMTERADIPTAEEIEARYDHTQHPNRLMRKDD